MSRVEVFHLCIDGAREILGDSVEFDHGSIADGLENAVVNRAHVLLQFVLVPQR